MRAANVLYTQQEPVSTEGFSAEAFSTTAPHTVRTKETKRCTDCHISQANDNNAKMAQLMTLGTNFVNFIGRFAWVGEGKKGLQAVAVTERDEPQAVVWKSSARARLSRRIQKARRRRSQPQGVLLSRGRGVPEHPESRRDISTPPMVPAASRSMTSRTSTTRSSPSVSRPRQCRRSASAPMSRRNSPPQ